MLLSIIVYSYWFYLPGFNFLVPAYLGSPGQNPESRKMVVVVVVCNNYSNSSIQYWCSILKREDIVMLVASGWDCVNKWVLRCWKVFCVFVCSMHQCTVCRNDKCIGIPAISRAVSVPESVDCQISVWSLCSKFMLCIVDDSTTGYSKIK